MLNRKLLPSDSLLIAALSFVGYCFAFAYQVGFCDLYHIPRDFISLNLSVALASSIGFAGASYAVLSNLSPKLSEALQNDNRARDLAYILTALFLADVFAVSNLNVVAL